MGFMMGDEYNLYKKNLIFCERLFQIHFITDAMQ